MKDQKPFKQSFGMSEEEYDKLYPPKKHVVQDSQRVKDLKRLDDLITKLEDTHELDGLEKSEVREIVRLTGAELKGSHSDYVGIKQHKHKSSKKKYVVGTIIVIVLLVMGVLVAADSNLQRIKENEAKKQVEEQARIAADPITASGIYTAVNTLRSKAGSPALANINELTTAAQQTCDDMATAGYFDYKNPTTGKEANSRIVDNKGNRYFKTYVSSISYASAVSGTATEAAKTLITNQATNINNPVFNSVGWVVCTPTTKAALVPEKSVYIVGMLAQEEQKPAPVNNYVVPKQVPQITLPKTQYTDCKTDIFGTTRCTTRTY